MASKKKRHPLEFVPEDDFVEYFLFVPIISVDEELQEITLKRLLLQALKITEKYTKDYLWHKDEFKLTARTGVNTALIKEEEPETLPPHLHGVTHFGDNIEDEWFIVFLLRELTKEIDGLVARVFDADGEFLLIEAAEYLPSWADPTTCEKRVYLFQGNVHLIPLEDATTPVAIGAALSIIGRSPFSTMATPEIQYSIANKIRDYPGKICTNLHHATAYLPVGVAAILKRHPKLIAPAVQAFCNRDTVDAKTIRAMKYFPPENRVNARVGFTRCLYAMVTHSKYVPDRTTGWGLPKMGSTDYKRYDLGVKIACGFEILASQGKTSNDLAGASQGKNNNDLRRDPSWEKYLEGLVERGYFRGLLEGSRFYNHLLNRAKGYYVSHREAMYFPPYGEVLHLVNTLDYKIDDLKKEEGSLPPDDDDSWLNITPEEVDKMLEEQYGQKKFVTVNNNTSQTLSEKLSQFLNHVSDFEGAEHPDLDNDNSPTRPPRGVKKRNKVSFAQDTKNDSKSNRVSFDPDAFSCAVHSILHSGIPEDDNWDLDSGSDMSDYADESANDKAFEGVNNKMHEYMQQMDEELAATTIGESFEKKNGDNFDDIENFKPVDIDLNALKNILESYRAQMGDAGPSSNMLGPMGVHLEAEKD